MHHTLRALTCSTLLLLGAGCASDRVIDVIPIGGRQDFRKGDFDVSVDNFSGSVSVLVVKDSEPVVRIRPVDAAPGRRSAPINLGRATYLRTDKGTRLHVVTKDQVGPVHLSIILPECGSVQIRNSNGPVDVRGSTGSIDVQNGSTGQFAHVNIFSESGLNMPISIHSGYGDIVLHAGQQSAGAISSHTPRGTTDVSAAQMGMRDVNYERGFFSGSLNSGTEGWRFDATNGSVRLTFDRYVEPLVK